MHCPLVRFGLWRGTIDKPPLLVRGDANLADARQVCVRSFDVDDYEAHNRHLISSQPLGPSQLSTDWESRSVTAITVGCSPLWMVLGEVGYRWRPNPTLAVTYITDFPPATLSQARGGSCFAPGPVVD